MVHGGVGPWRSRRRSSAPRQEQLNILITVGKHRLEQGGPPEFATMATLTILATLITMAKIASSFLLLLRPQGALLVPHRVTKYLNLKNRDHVRHEGTLQNVPSEFQNIITLK